MRRTAGSARSRSPSPIMFRPSTSIRIARPGKMESQGASRMFSKPSRIMPPQVGVGGCAPRPTKASDASVRTAAAIQSVPMTSTSLRMLGRMWMTRSRACENPARGRLR